MTTRRICTELIPAELQKQIDRMRMSNLVVLALYGSAEIEPNLQRAREYAAELEGRAA